MTRYHDDGARWAAVDYSDFDGLGHYRTATTSGNFGSGDVRSTTTTYNEANGTYPGSFVMPSVVGGPTITQTRSFSYDNRGFLLSESHPEKSAAVTYSGFDACGHATQRVDGPNTLVYQFDKAERMTLVKEPGGSGRTLTELSYSTANNVGGSGLSLGKVRWADRYNYLILSGNPVTARIRETYTYQGRGGRVSQRVTENFLLGNPTPADTWTQGWEYNNLGDLRSIDYPDCIIQGCVGVDQPRQVERPTATAGSPGSGDAGSAAVAKLKTRDRPTSRHRRSATLTLVSGVDGAPA